MTQLFLSFEIICNNCGCLNTYRESSEESKLIGYPFVTCTICKCKIGPGKLTAQRLDGRARECYTFDCDWCGRFNTISNNVDDCKCKHCNVDNHFE